MHSRRSLVGGATLILLVSGATGYPRSATVGHLIVPRQWNDPATLDLSPGRWAMDNGAFSGFDEGAYVRMLERHDAFPGCLFVSAPDVLGDAAATLMRWPFWSKMIRGCGHAPAFVLQDGITAERVPWDEVGAVFVGGSTAFKESDDVRTLMAYAKARGIWTHWGRVNGKRRYGLALKCGVDSIDGSGFSMYPDTNIPLAEQWRFELTRQPELEL